MGMYCCCGVKKRDGWQCECDWTDWFLCFEVEGVSKDIPIKKIPDKDGMYQVRCFEDGDYYEDESMFCLTEKNWGQDTNKQISHWEIEYSDGWMGYRGVYAWKDEGKGGKVG